MCLCQHLSLLLYPRSKACRGQGEPLGVFNRGVGDVTGSAWSSKVLSVSLNLLHAKPACLPACQLPCLLPPVFHSLLSAFFAAAQAPPLFVHTAVRRIQMFSVYCSLSKQFGLYCHVLSSCDCSGLRFFPFIGLFYHSVLSLRTHEFT